MFFFNIGIRYSHYLRFINLVKKLKIYYLIYIQGISMTDASGKPYSTNGHGSVASMNTTATTLTGLSDASTITRSPLRSSLKKPRPREGEPGGLGIQNPGYSGHSPPLNRNGSQKKVRIQTHSTEVWTSLSARYNLGKLHMIFIKFIVKIGHSEIFLSVGHLQGFKRQD